MTLRQPLSPTGTRIRGPVLLCTAALAAVSAAPADAAVTAPTILAGPSASIAELGDVALASDGSGGAIWRTKDADSGSHIQVASYVDGKWSAPQRIDTAGPYDSSNPRLAAGPGGRLIAIWSQIWAQTTANVPVLRLQAAQLRPGSTRFETPFTIDSKVGDIRGNVDQLAPTIKMNDGGVAYVAYRAVHGPAQSQVDFPAFPGDTDAEFRVARFNGASWSKVGVVNRNPAYSVPGATDGNGPQVSVDRQGNGIVAFLEPDANGTERVYARRLFGARPGYVLKASAQALNGQPINGDVKAFSLSGGGFGTAVVATLQQPGRPSPLAGPAIIESVIADSESDDARDFGAPAVVNAPAGLLAPPAAATTSAAKHGIAFGAGSAVCLAAIGKAGPSDPDCSDGGVPSPSIRFTAGPSGASTTAWTFAKDGAEAVAVRQVGPDGAVSRPILSGGTAGEVSELRLAGSGQGDALIGFRQDSGESTRIVVAATQVAPQSFLAYGPDDWVLPAAATVTWDRPASGVGGLRYQVIVDGRIVARDLAGTSYQFPRGLLDDGNHQVQIRAIDLSGQAATSNRASVNVDGTAPVPTATLKSGRRVRVSVKDVLPGASPDSVVGVRSDSVSVKFGDGSSKRGSAVASHQYRRPGRYTIKIVAADKLGNADTTTLRVTIR